MKNQTMIKLLLVLYSVYPLTEPLTIERHEEGDILIDITNKVTCSEIKNTIYNSAEDVCLCDNEYPTFHALNINDFGCYASENLTSPQGQCSINERDIAKNSVKLVENNQFNITISISETCNHFRGGKVFEAVYAFPHRQRPFYRRNYSIGLTITGNQLTMYRLATTAGALLKLWGSCGTTECMLVKVDGEAIFDSINEERLTTPIPTKNALRSTITETVPSKTPTPSTKTTLKTTKNHKKNNAKSTTSSIATTLVPSKINTETNTLTSTSTETTTPIPPKTTTTTTSLATTLVTTKITSTGSESTETEITTEKHMDTKSQYITSTAKDTTTNVITVPPPDKQSSDGVSLALIIGVIASILLLIIIILVIWRRYRKKKMKNNTPNTVMNPSYVDTIQPSMLERRESNDYTYAYMSTDKMNIKNTSSNNTLASNITNPTKNEHYDAQKSEYTSLNMDENPSSERYGTLTSQKDKNMYADPTDLYQETEPVYFETEPECTVYEEALAKQNPEKIANEPLYFETTPDLYAEVQKKY